jgi:hypothetical protein
VRAEKVLVQSPAFVGRRGQEFFEQQPFVLAESGKASHAFAPSAAFFFHEFNLVDAAGQVEADFELGTVEQGFHASVACRSS